MIPITKSTIFFIGSALVGPFCVDALQNAHATETSLIQAVGTGVPSQDPNAGKFAKQLKNKVPCAISEGVTFNFKKLVILAFVTFAEHGLGTGEGTDDVIDGLTGGCKNEDSCEMLSATQKEALADMSKIINAVNDEDNVYEKLTMSCQQVTTFLDKDTHICPCLDGVFTAYQKVSESDASP
eukprot:gene819-865_t